MNEGKLLELLKQHEGCRLKAYKDTVGVWTIGYGRNLQTMTITQKQAEEWLIEDMHTAITAAKRFPEYAFLDTDARQAAFIEMVYNLGSLGLSRFTNMLTAIIAKDWAQVAIEALDSTWAKQVGARANVLSAMYFTGKFH